ncbi:MAG: hypothetical protein U9N56_08365 [Actinomycetota bacterium]|nr:hypothetical protein [Actinomycetota bacterium]
MRRAVAWLALAGLALGACSTGVDPSIVLASSAQGIGVGQQRILIAVTDLSTGDFLAAPGIDVVGTLRNTDGSPLDESAGRFLWALPDESGVYAFEFTIPEADTFQVTVRSDEWGDVGPIGLVALEDPSVVGVGEEAPLSATRTTATHPLEEITSDPNPDPSLYDMSIAEAVEEGPAVIVFSTFVGCSDACGTLLDQVKALAPGFAGIGFVHVDVYEDVSGDDAGLVAAVAEWGLPTEPWLFVIDASGTVRSRMEGAASDEELESSIALVAPQK